MHVHTESKESESSWGRLSRVDTPQAFGGCPSGSPFFPNSLPSLFSLPAALSFVVFLSQVPYCPSSFTQEWLEWEGVIFDGAAGISSAGAKEANHLMMHKTVPYNKGLSCPKGKCRH